MEERLRSIYLGYVDKHPFFTSTWLEKDGITESLRKIKCPGRPTVRINKKRQKRFIGCTHYFPKIELHVETVHSCAKITIYDETHSRILTEMFNNEIRWEMIIPSGHTSLTRRRGITENVPFTNSH